MHTRAKEAPADGAPAQGRGDKEHPGVQKHCPNLKWWYELSQSSAGAQAGKGQQEKLLAVH